MQEQEQYISDLKQENSLLIELLEAAKADYNDSLAVKDKKMKVLLIEYIDTCWSGGEAYFGKLVIHETNLKLWNLTRDAKINGH